MGSKCESVDNNLCESFNHAIVDARFYPVISMQEKIRKKIFARIQEQREKGEKFHGKICPSIFKKLKAMMNKSLYCCSGMSHRSGHNHAPTRGHRVCRNQHGDGEGSSAHPHDHRMSQC